MAKTEKDPLDIKVRDFITGKTRAGLSQTLFVRAGAGAGKTHCLQERVKNLLLYHDVKPDRLAVITYTIKAAAEIKDRIRLGFEKAASSDQDTAERAKAAGLLDELNKAKMSTVHAFCFDLLKEYPVEFGIDPACEITDDRATAALKREVRKLFYTAEALNDPRFTKEIAARQRLQNEFPGGMGEDQLFAFFSVLYENRELKARRLKASSADEQGALRGQMQAHLAQLVEDITNGIEKAIKDESDRLYLRRPEILQKLARHGITPDKKNPDCSALLEDILLSGESPFPSSAGAKGSYRDPKFLPDYKARAKALSELLDTYRQEQAVCCYNVLLDIYPLYASLYAEFKRTHGLLDFADCLILLRNGLRDKPFLKAALQNRFDVIIVDEFQDSDPLQSEILFHLAAVNVDASKNWEDQELVPGKLTFMGDPKQSIFGFARADIAIYLKVMKLITIKDKKADQVLSTNFRSLPGILDFVNRHFDKIIVKHPTEPFASPEYEAMQPYKEDIPDDPSVQVFRLGLGLASDSAETEGIGKQGMGVPEQRNREAWAIARFIAEQIKLKKATAGDYMILFRKAAGMEAYEDALERHGVPAINTKTTAFLQLPDVLSLISLMGLLVRPNDSHYLYASLRSVYLGFSDEEIQALFAKCEGKPTLAKLAALQPSLQPLLDLANGQEPLPARFESACHALRIYSHGQALGDETLLSSVTHLSEILKAELTLNNFNERLTVENILAGALKVSFAGKRDNDEMEEEKLILETFKPSKVRLMTVHSSKGLESRFVIIANPSADTMTGVDVLVDRDRGEILPLKHPVLGQKLIELPLLVPAKAREVIFKVEEEKRVLYVAATRAIETLYLLKYGDDETGSFTEPLMGIVDATTATRSLQLGEDYLKRHAPKAKVTTPTPASLTPEAMLAKQQVVCAGLNERAALSQAVTTMLQKEASEIFKDNRDGRSRGKDFGNLTHLAMDWICKKAALKKVVTEAEVGAHLQALNDETFNFDAENLVPLAEGLTRFLQSELYGKILSARSVMSEVAFQVVGEVHGVIDLVYVDSDGVHIVDWKSDRFSSPERAALVKGHYEKQIAAYFGALESRLGQRVVSRSCVYLF